MTSSATDMTAQSGHGAVLRLAWDYRLDVSSHSKFQIAFTVTYFPLRSLNETFRAEKREVHHAENISCVDCNEADVVVGPQRLISAAATWGGNPRKDAMYLNFTPPKNDGKTKYKLHLDEVPVDGFWSISLYNADGYFQKNDLGAYSLNNITSKKSADGSTDIQFGGCDARS